MIDAAENQPKKWAKIVRGDGTITGYLQVFRASGNHYVSVPGVSKFVDAADVQDDLISPETMLEEFYS